MEEFRIKDRYTLEDVPKFVARLRNRENGCAWDMQQTHESMRQNFLEEVCEAMDAIDRHDETDLREELGDVLLQVCMHAEMEKEKGTFDIDGISDTLIKKLVLRHPHLFGEVKTNDTEQILSNWEDIKRVEKSQQTGSQAIEAVPKALPALMRSQKVQKRAAYVGFDLAGVGEAAAKLRELAEELEKAGEDEIFDKVGEVLFAAVGVARLGHVDAELALTRTCERFAEAFKKLEEITILNGMGIDYASSLVLMEDLWKDAKK